MKKSVRRNWFIAVIVIAVILLAGILIYNSQKGVLFSPPTNGLILQKTFDESTTKGIIGNAFNVTNYYNSLGSGMKLPSGSFNPGSGSFTISVWVKTSGSDSLMEIVSKRNAATGTENGFDLAIESNGGIYSYYGDGVKGIVTRATPKSSIKDDKWHNIAISYTRGSVSNVYVDGKVKVSVVSVSGTVSNSVPLCVGAGGKDCRFAKFNGLIDDLRIYNRVLSDIEIKGIYEEVIPPTQEPTQEKYLMKFTGWTQESGIEKVNVEYMKSGVWTTVKEKAKAGDVVSLGNMEFKVDYVSKTRKIVNMDPMAYMDPNERLSLQIASKQIIFDGKVNNYFVVSLRDFSESYTIRATNWAIDSDRDIVDFEYKKDGIWTTIKDNAKNFDIVTIGNTEITVNNINHNLKLVNLDVRNGFFFKESSSPPPIVVFDGNQDDYFVATWGWMAG